MDEETKSHLREKLMQSDSLERKMKLTIIGIGAFAVSFLVNARVDDSKYYNYVNSLPAEQRDNPPIKQATWQNFIPCYFLFNRYDSK